MTRIVSMLDAHETVWIDATDLVDWRGQFTGIQRVEFNLATRFVELDNVRFFAFSDGKFYTIDFRVLQAEIESELQRDDDDEDSTSPPVRSVARRRLKQTLGKTLHVTPLVSKDLVVAAYDKFAHKGKGVSRKVRAGLGAARPLQATLVDLGEEVVFARGDLVLVLGGNWHKEGFMETLGRALRRTAGISMGHVIYDLIPAVQPAFFPEVLVDEFTEYMQLALEDATVCFAISEHSKVDALTFAERSGIDAPPIHTFRLGDYITLADPKRPKELDADETQVPEEFVFCPGTVEVRKNHQSLYHAYRLAAHRGLELPHLIIGGKRGWLAGDIWFQMQHDPLVKDSITILSSCQDREFAWLYENCMFTVYPSLYEGWGLPVAESLQYGKVCLASSASSIPEIAGDLLDYFAPDDTNEILEKVHRYASDPELLAKKEAEIAANYSPATWDEAFRQVVAAIQSES